MIWDNPEFVDLVRAIARGEGGDAERAEATAILQEDLPVIPIAWYQQTLAVSREIEGATVDRFELTFGLQNLEWRQ